MKLSYRSNKFLDLQKKHGSFWVDKLGATDIVQRITIENLGRKIDWHVESSLLLRDIFKNKLFKNIFFTKTLVEKAKKHTSIKKSLLAFRNIKRDVGCVIIDNKNSFIYGIYEGKFVGFYLNDGNVVNVELLTINKDSTDYSYSSLLCTLLGRNSRNPDLANVHFVKQEKTVIEDLIPLLTVYHFAEIETEVISCSKKRKVKITGEKYINETDIPVQIINSNWFTNIIRNEGFNVKGHFRLQPCGKGRKDRKLIWINEFEKSGYTRKAKLSLSE